MVGTDDDGYRRPTRWFPRHIARARTSPYLSRVYISRARVDAHHLARDTTRGHIASTHRSRARSTPPPVAHWRAAKGRPFDRGGGRLDSTTGRDRSMGRRDRGFGLGTTFGFFPRGSEIFLCADRVVGTPWWVGNGRGRTELGVEKVMYEMTRRFGGRATSSLSLSFSLSLSLARASVDADANDDHGCAMGLSSSKPMALRRRRYHRKMRKTTRTAPPVHAPSA